MAYELDSEMRTRLARQYRVMLEQELLQLAERPQDLTDMAQETLRAELQERGIACPDQPADQADGIPKPDRFGFLWPGSAGDPFKIAQQGVLPKPEFGTMVEKGRVALVTMYDAIDTRQACDALDEAGVPFEVRDRSVTQSGLRGFGDGPVVALELVIEKNDRERAVKLLRETMGLFPLEEIAEPDAVVDDGTVATLGDFGKRVDAEEVARVLSEASVWNRITENEEGSAETEDAYLVEVREVDLTGAVELVEKALGLAEG